MLQAIEAYNLLFTEYPDIVGIDDMRKMLGNISRKSAYKLIREKKIEAFKIGKEYKVPKLNILSYLNMAKQ